MTSFIKCQAEISFNFTIEKASFAQKPLLNLAKRLISSIEPNLREELKESFISEVASVTDEVASVTDEVASVTELD